MLFDSGAKLEREMRVYPGLLLLALLLSCFLPGAAAGSTTATVVITGTVVNPGQPGGAQGGAAPTGGGQTGSSSTYVPPPPGPVPPAAAPAVPTFYGSGPVDTTSGGTVREAVRITSLDHDASLLIPAGSLAVDAAGDPLTRLSIDPVPSGGVPSSPSAGAPLWFAGLAYEISPAGAKFSPPAPLTLTLPRSLWSDGAEFFILSYDAKAGSTTGLPATVNPATLTLTGAVSGAGIFGFSTGPASAPPPAAALPSPILVNRQAPEPVFLAGIASALASTAAANIPVLFTAFLAILAGTFAYTNRALISRYQDWISLYLISMTGVLWAAFAYSEGGPLQETVFILTTVAGLNLIVHIFRFDRVVIPIPVAGG